MRIFKKSVSIIAVAVLLTACMSCFAFATTATVSGYAGQTVEVTFTEPDCYGISGDITYSDRGMLSAVTPATSTYGQINENHFILSSTQKVNCVVTLRVKISDSAVAGSKCVISLSDYIRIDNGETLEGPEGLNKSITVEVKKNPEIKDTSKIFKDVKAKIWYKKYVDYAYAYGIFTGTSADTFSPNANITRAQFVQVLANLEGVDTSNRNVKTMFTDVPAKKWYTAAVKWASENKVVSGMGDGTFAPDANVTREQMCLMLTNFAGFKKITLKQVEAKALFADDAKIAKWAKTAVYVCQQADIVNGKGENKFDPKGTGTRAEAAVIFTKFHQDYIMQ